MHTLADLTAISTPQVIGILHMFGHSMGGLDRIKCAEFESRFPIRFEDLKPGIRTAFPSAHTYHRGRQAVVRALSCAGYIDEPWEALRHLIRRVGLKQEIELHWGGLKTPATAASLAPAQLTSDWVWSLEAEAEGGMRRQRLRRAVVCFNRLFEVSEVAESGLLPPAPISAPPVYDRSGVRKAELPPVLSLLHAGALQHERTAINKFWQVVHMTGTDLGDNPAASELLERMGEFRGLPAATVGLAESSWIQYCRRVTALLKKHMASRPRMSELPHATWDTATEDTIQESRLDRGAAGSMVLSSRIARSLHLSPISMKRNR